MDGRGWGPYSQALRTSAPFRALLKRRGDVIGLPLPAAAWVGEVLADQLGRRVVAIVPRESDALTWVEAAELFGGTGRTVYFPAPSLAPYQEAEPTLLVRAREAVALDAILSGVAKTVVCTPRALFRKLPTADTFASGVRKLVPNEDCSIDSLAESLLRWGYHRSDLVMEVGEFATRGGIFDLFPPGSDTPLRLDFFGDTLESVRTFEPASQRSQETLDSARILPLSLFPEGTAEAESLGRLIRDTGGPDLDEEVADKLRLLASIASFPGWQNYLPALGTATAGLMELIPDALPVAVDPQALQDEATHHGELLTAEFESRRQVGRWALPPEELERSLPAVMVDLGAAEIRLRSLGVGAGEAIDFQASLTDNLQGQLPRFPNEAATVRARGEDLVLVVREGHRRQLAELLEGRGLVLGSGGIHGVSGELQRGFRLPAAGLSIYSEHQLFGRLAPAVRRSKPRYGPFIASLRDLKVGDYVVHADHGIGRFVGLRTVGEEGGSAPDLPPTLRPEPSIATSSGVEVMEIAYKSGKTLLLPLPRLDQIQKYSGIEGVAPRLDTLGGASWNKTKKKVQRSLRDMAEELTKLYAERQLAEASRMPPDSDLVSQFETAFEFEETPDQLEAIASIKADLERRRPMDRLLCGDVGYGKTEVAMRAAFKVVDGGFQVAVLAPTTILADQHLETFRKRFDGFPITIEMVSRLRTNAEVRILAKDLAAGKVDILIGTHRLLSRRLEFAKLGLLIVDEEQRFGVAQKEQLKQFKKNVHVMAMSATPVPRTLQLSLAGVRDLSVIETPPKDRMAVETAILPFTSELVREAIEFELERGGQVYFVYNRVESIEAMQSFLREAVPAARVTVGHGQMDEHELSKRMHAFTAGEYDVLLATTIIENGIHIPNVNTMIVHRADRFGLAQLYQLRGRVGRSDQLAYCYLLVPSDRVLSETARKRLAAIREFTDLGAGFRIAARDLEIRGAGNLLGAEQSGHIMAVGIETYLKMLEEAVRELRGEPVEEAPSATIDLPVAMSIPQAFIEDANLRMEVYRKIAAGEDTEEEILSELEDRFGRAPTEVRQLLRVASLKRRAETLRVQSVVAHRGKLVLRLRQDARVDVERLISIVSQHEGSTFSPTGALTLPAAVGSLVLDQALDLVDTLAEAPVSAAEGVA